MIDKTIQDARKRNTHTLGSLPWATEEMKCTRKELDAAIDAITERIRAEEAKPASDQNHGMLVELSMMKFELAALSKAVDDVWLKPKDRAMSIIRTWFDLRMRMHREELTKSFYK